MNPAYIAGGLVLGIVIGLISGIVGIGGGALLVPALVYFFGMSQLKAQGTSLATLLMPVGFFAVAEYYRAGEINVRFAIVLAMGFAIGGFFGGSLAQQLPTVLLRKGFAVLLAAVAVRMFFTK